MRFSPSVSSILAIVFITTGISGIALWFNVKDALTIFLHTYFAIGLLFISVFHIFKNFASLKFSLKKRFSLLFLAVIFIIQIGIFSGFAPFERLINWNAKRLSMQGGGEVNWENQITYQMEIPGDSGSVSLDFLAGKHFWHPQVVIWTEDTAGSYLQTLFITHATARGNFYGSRTRENFKEFDENSIADHNDKRRVDALPYWSHKRGIKYPDGYFSPPPDNPLADGISGATPSGNFIVKARAEERKFRLLVEVNIAFDENQFYSEYDFPDDPEYHGGTGLMGQPSIIFEATIDPALGKQYKLMKLIGRGHHSGADGSLYKDLETITTAHEIFERIVVGYNLK